LFEFDYAPMLLVQFSDILAFHIDGFKRADSRLDKQLYRAPFVKTVGSKSQRKR